MERKQLMFLTKFWVIWIWGYILVGAVSTMKNSTSFLAAPVELGFPIWFKLTILNLPLQIALALSAAVLVARKPDGRPSRVTTVVSLAATVLMAANLVVAIWLLIGH